MTRMPTYRLSGLVQTPHSEEKTDFEGPLDLILFLLREHKIEIADLKIAELLEQYLAYLDEMKRMDLEIASEFIAMASHLVYLKSRMLLTVGEQKPDDEMELLMRALEQRQREEEFERVQQGIEMLAERAAWGRDMFVRPPEPMRREGEYIRRHEPEELLKAIQELSQRAVRRAPPQVAAFNGIVGQENFPIPDKITQILSVLEKKGRILLRNILKKAQSRSEVVAMFLAVLEMCRNRTVLVHEQGDDWALSAEETNGTG